MPANDGAQGSPWVVFRDADGECPVDLRRRLEEKIDKISPRFLLRVAVGMNESWLMADREGCAEYFYVSLARVPADVEGLTHAKTTLLNLCRSSAAREVRNDMVTDDGRVGPLYAVRLNDYASNGWNIKKAADGSPRLSRALERIRSLS